MSDQHTHERARGGESRHGAFDNQLAFELVKAAKITKGDQSDEVNTRMPADHERHDDRFRHFRTGLRPTQLAAAPRYGLLGRLEAFNLSLILPNRQVGILGELTLRAHRSLSASW